MKTSTTVCQKRLLSIFFLNLFCLISQVQAQAKLDKAELVEQLKEKRIWLDGLLVDKFITLNLSPACWQEFNKDDIGVDHFSRWGRAIADLSDFIGTGNLNEISGFGVDAVTEKQNRPKAQELAKNMDGKFSFTIQAADLTCDPMAFRLLQGYSTAIRDFIANGSTTHGFNRGWRPASGQMHIALVLSNKVKDISVVISPDKKKFTVTGPSHTEVSEWDTKIYRGLERGGN
jgi:hypothetical protein